MSAESNATNLFTPGRIVATLAVAVLVASVGYMLLTSRSEGENALKLELPGSQLSSSSNYLPPDFEIKTIDGRTIKLSDYRGKVVVLDFWATWCPPCREGTPQLVRLANEKRDRGVEVIGLHIDDRGRSSPDAIRKFAQQFNVSYTIGLATDDVFTSYLGTADDTIPQSLVFDRRGKAIAHFVGYSSSSAQELDEAVNRALGGS